MMSAVSTSAPELRHCRGGDTRVVMASDCTTPLLPLGVPTSWHSASGAQVSVPTARFVNRASYPEMSVPEPDGYEHLLWPGAGTPPDDFIATLPTAGRHLQRLP